MHSTPAGKIGKKTYQMLGRVLVNKHPDLAHELLQTCCNSEASDTDLTHIPIYYEQFCRHMKISQEEYKGKLSTRAKLEVRRLFISCMIRIYNPQVYLQPKNNFIFSRGFGRKIAQVFNLTDGMISQMIHQLVLDEKNYQHFRESVDVIKDHIYSLKQLQHGKD